MPHFFPRGNGLVNFRMNWAALDQDLGEKERSLGLLPLSHCMNLRALLSGCLKKLNKKQHFKHLECA